MCYKRDGNINSIVFIKQTKSVISDYRYFILLLTYMGIKSIIKVIISSISTKS